MLFHFFSFSPKHQYDKHYVLQDVNIKRVTVSPNYAIVSQTSEIRLLISFSFAIDHFVHFPMKIVLPLLLVSEAETTFPVGNYLGLCLSRSQQILFHLINIFQY